MNKSDPTGLKCATRTGSHICETDKYNGRNVGRDKNGAPIVTFKSPRRPAQRNPSAEAKVKKQDASMTKAYSKIKSNPDAKYSKTLTGEGYPENGLKMDFTGADLAEVAENTEVNVETKNVPADPDVRADTTAHGYMNVYADRIAGDTARQESLTHELVHGTPAAADFTTVKGVEGFPEHQQAFREIVQQILGD